jgi:hypothetical protein
LDSDSKQTTQIDTDLSPEPKPAERDDRDRKLADEGGTYFAERFSRPNSGRRYLPEHRHSDRATPIASVAPARLRGNGVCGWREKVDGRKARKSLDIKVTDFTAPR